MSASALSKGLFVCEVCDLPNRPLDTHCHCARCGANLHARIPDSIARGWAFLAAAANQKMIPNSRLLVITSDAYHIILANNDLRDLFAECLKIGR